MPSTPADPPRPPDGSVLTELEPGPRRRVGRVVIAAAAVAVIVVGGLLIWSPWSQGSSTKYSAANEPLRVFASVTPHAEILNYVNDELAGDDFSLEIIEESDGINGNDVVANGDADASYFQHVPFFESDTKAKGYTGLRTASTVHLEPYGIYANNSTSLQDVPQGGLVLLSNNVSNVARGLYLLQEAGLITLPYKFGDTSAEALAITEDDIVSNPKKLVFKQLEPAQIPRSLPDASLALINGNFALQSGLKPAQDALLLEKAEGNPYANVLTVPDELAQDPRVRSLQKVLEGPEVAAYISRTYPGSVIPATKGN